MRTKKLPLPTTQLQEVLYELINRFSIDHKSMILSCGVLNLTACISDLRILNVPIETIKITSVNKFGRKVIYGRWKLIDKKIASEIYIKMFERGE